MTAASVPGGARPVRRAVTIVDVALAAGVSAATVSKVLHGRDGVAPGTAERVRTTAASLDYVPNPAAQRLRGGAEPVIGVVVRVLDGWSVEVLRGVALATDQLGLAHVSAINAGDLPGAAWGLRAVALLAGFADAVVVIGDEPPATTLPLALVPRPDAYRAGRGNPAPGVLRRRARLAGAMAVQQLAHRMAVDSAGPAPASQRRTGRAPGGGLRLG